MINKLIPRYLKEINESLRQAEGIVKDITEDVKSGNIELQSVRSAAKQAEQAAADLNKLAGILECRNSQ